MKEGSVGPWKEAFLEEAYLLNAQNIEKGFGTFVAFTTKFHNAFESLSPAAECISKMKALKQTGPVEDYIATFHPLATHSTVIDVNVLSDYFLTGLSNGLRCNVLSVEKLPTMMKNYYALAVCLDLQWCKAKEYEQNTQAPSSLRWRTAPPPDLGS